MKNMGYYSDVRKVIEEQILLGRRDFILYPFGEQGLLVKEILNKVFGIQEKCIIDNYLCKFNSSIKDVSYLNKYEYKSCVVLITSDNEEVYDVLRNTVKKYVGSERIVDIFKKFKREEDFYPKVGKYSYGPLCSNHLVESIGAFCSFGPLTDVLLNHGISYISTHPFLYRRIHENDKGRLEWHVEGVEPKGKMHKNKKVVIGNDVWLGRNVVITNGARIGNGVIAGAGAVITKDIPDYAIVGGVPARIIRFRYSKKQIKELNDIAWWDWTDDKIRINYDDFYDEIDIFIKKHRNDNIE